MENFMNAEKLYIDDKFISDQLKFVPKYFRDQISKDEIKSDLALAICACAKYFDPKKGKNISPYVRLSFMRNLQKTVRDKQFYLDSEAPLEAANNLTYEDKPTENIELITYLSLLPNDLLGELTEFALGKKNKEEIVSNPSFKKLNINRIIEKLDQLV